MILVHTSIPFDPDRYDEAIEFVQDLTERSQREAGTVRYRAMVDLGDRYTVRFFEQYEDEEAWTAHTQTEHYQRFINRLPELVDGIMETISIIAGQSPQVHHFTAEDIARVDS